MTGRPAHSAQGNAAVAEVLIPVGVDQTYSYAVPEDLSVAVGDFVEVPLGTRLAEGVVWRIARSAPAGADLKTIVRRLPLLALSQAARDFIEWVARWTLSPRGMVLRMMVTAPFQAGPEVPRVGVRLIGRPSARLTPARARVLAAFETGLTFSKKALAEAAACSVSVIESLIDEGTLGTMALPREPVAHPCDPDFARPSLELDQRRAADFLTACVRNRNFSVELLEGVTGSGKTEVYFEAIAAAVQVGSQCLILLPEIALTAQFLDRFARRFGAGPGEWHSSLSARKRARLWQAAASGEVKVVAGARSALFLPFHNLGLIIVDEEHDAAYKQEEGVAYHARDMAVVRGRIEKAAVILSTATPSIETQVNAAQGRYAHVKLQSRFNARPLPRIESIDLRKEAPPPGRWTAPRLASAIRATLAAGEQALLFLNRRGYAPLTLCRACGHRFQCPQCTAWLVEHRFRRSLICHQCGHVERRPSLCPSCGAVESLTACGPGIERLAEEVATLFPQARILTLSSDFPGGAERLRAEIESVARGACDLLIGTQLVAKGHNFPQLSLVGVIDADIGLMSGDPRAAERTFQLLQQVTGRAGRFAAKGRALVQSWQPEHPVMRALLSGDSASFYEEETSARSRAGLPPFGRLASLVISAKNAVIAERFARDLLRAAYALPSSKDWTLAPAGQMAKANELSLLGPAEAPVAVIRGRHRYRLLVRAPRSADLQGFLRAWLAAGPKERGGVRIAVDVDPQSFM